MGSMAIKLSLSVLLASIVFLLRDKRWLILLSLVVDTWCIANLIYMRNNYILLDAEAFNQAANLHGYWKSTLIYIQWGVDLSFYAMTGLMCLVFVLGYRSERCLRDWLIVAAIGAGLHLTGDMLHHGLRYNSILRDQREQVYGTSYSLTVGRTSLMEAPLYILSDYRQMVRDELPKHPMTDEDTATATRLSQGDSTLKSPDKLIIVLLESLENWVCRPDIMPNLYRLSQSEHVLYADYIHTQIVGAPSADGQMIVNTGLLPITAGATCLHYPHNLYPSLMQLSPDSCVLLLPHDPKVWNQTEMSPAFGYDTTIVFGDIDTLLFKELNRLVDHGYTHIQCITQSTHAPFLNEQYSSLPLPKDMPWVMHNFIRGFNALDHGLGLFLEKLATDSALQQYTIVLTGDHRILHTEIREQMQEYADSHHMDLCPSNDCLPLIIYSPKIEGNRYVRDEAWQMDIYPTVLHLLGAEDYYWSGLGENLMDDQAIGHRRFTPQEAGQLSDRMIRADWFYNFLSVANR